MSESEHTVGRLRAIIELDVSPNHGAAGFR